jgi:hypothetical protein
LENAAGQVSVQKYQPDKLSVGAREQELGTCANCLQSLGHEVQLWTRTKTLDFFDVKAGGIPKIAQDESGIQTEV